MSEATLIAVKLLREEADRQKAFLAAQHDLKTAQEAIERKYSELATTLTTLAAENVPKDITLAAENVPKDIFDILNAMAWSCLVLLLAGASAVTYAIISAPGPGIRD